MSYLANTHKLKVQENDTECMLFMPSLITSAQLDDCEKHTTITFPQGMDSNEEL